MGIDMIRTKVRQWVEQNNLLPKGSNIVAACSGGPDSLALVDLLDEFRWDMDFSLSVAHFDHSLRGDESCQEAEYVRLFCLNRSLPFFLGSADVKAEMRRCGGSLEEVARRLRYSFLRQVAVGTGGALIATGHHRDDQAETVLLNLVRGSGGRGMGAMRARQAEVVRPILCLNRIEIEAYCLEQRLKPCEDSSNSNVEFYRNRIRHELIPLLRQRFNPAISDCLCRSAAIFADDQDFLRQYVMERFTDLAVRLDTGYQLDAAVFFQLHVSVQRQLLLVLLEQLRGDTRSISFSHVESIRNLFLHERGSRRIDLPGNWQARKSYQKLFIESTLPEGVGARRSLAFSAEIEKKTILNCPGDTVLPDLGVEIHCSLHSGPLPPGAILNNARVAFDRAMIGQLFVRHRYPGDLFRPLGAPGPRKLKKLLIDRKIPREVRDLLPIVFDESGILWLVGLCRAERGRITEQTQEYILMEIIPHNSID
jgi:tRNA(Ile)-lysidine synthase